LFTEVSNPKKLNRPSVVAMVVSFLPPEPSKMASVSGLLPPSTLAANETWPESFIEGLNPMETNRRGSSATVVRDPSALARYTPGIVLNPSGARRPALKATSPGVLIAAHPKLKGSKPSLALSATFVKVYCGAGGTVCARAPESIAPNAKATPPANRKATPMAPIIPEDRRIHSSFPGGTSSAPPYPPGISDILTHRQPQPDAGQAMHFPEGYLPACVSQYGSSLKKSAP
jgi:hypothetical protein